MMTGGRATTSYGFLNFLCVQRADGIEYNGKFVLPVGQQWNGRQLDRRKAPGERDRRFSPRGTVPLPVDITATHTARFAWRRFRAAGEQGQFRHGSCRVNHFAKPLDV
jgi:hypothetical protein